MVNADAEDDAVTLMRIFAKRRVRAAGEMVKGKQRGFLLLMMRMILRMIRGMLSVCCFILCRESVEE